jgi:hypothetical protein
VLFLDTTGVAHFRKLQHEELGRSSDGIWAACPDTTVAAVSERQPPVFLYFSRHCYDTAMAGLSQSQLEEAIRFRRGTWSPQASSYVLQNLMDVETARFEGLVRAASQQHENMQRAQLVENSLSLLQRLAGLERYGMVAAKGMAVAVLEGESMLISELQAALSAKLFEKTPEAAMLKEHLSRRKSWSAAALKVTAALGESRFGGELPFADVQRGVFIHPADARLERAMHRDGEPAVRWRDGLVLLAAGRHLDSIRQPQGSADILYADGGELQEALEFLTVAQRERDFAARFARSPEESRGDRLARMDRLHLHQILLKRELCNRKEARAGCVAAGFGTVLPQETEWLGRSLESTRTFSRKQGAADLEPDALIRRGSEMFAADLALFRGLAERHWPSLKSPFQRLSEQLPI